MSSAATAVAAGSVMLPLVTAQTVASERGVGGWISRRRTLGGKAQAARVRTRNSGRSTSSSSTSGWQGTKFQRVQGLRACEAVIKKLQRPSCHRRVDPPDELIQIRLRGGKQGRLDVFDGLV